jgi:hypothetical protein
VTHEPVTVPNLTCSQQADNSLHMLHSTRAICSVAYGAAPRKVNTFRTACSEPVEILLDNWNVQLQVTPFNTPGGSQPTQHTQISSRQLQAG